MERTYTTYILLNRLDRFERSTQKLYIQTVFNDAGIATNLKYAQNNKNVLHCVIKFLFVPTAKVDHVEFCMSFSNSFICKSER